MRKNKELFKFPVLEDIHLTDVMPSVKLGSDVIPSAKEAIQEQNLTYRVAEHLLSLVKKGTFKTSNGNLKIKKVQLVRSDRGMGHYGNPTVAITVDNNTYTLSLSKPIGVY